MRHLNKIIFLNSANIPYSEVSLDGNVHFAGTQGVGKSTILRALLFFYNADKTHLGIQSGQKSFDEFYFRHTNSFIVYEVATEHGSYSVLTGRNRGKVVYRFVDAPYSKDWFVVDDRGDTMRVDDDWNSIRERIGPGVDISPIIDTYDAYRDIIFGNYHDRKRNYDKYAIVKSYNYQNIPRSIQNVFLNSKLDADFVKTTIIRSMTDNEDTIQLSTYRRLVSDFEREFNEIDCWYRKDKDGKIPVRIKADTVIDTYRLLIALEYELRQTWHKLNHAARVTRERLPFVEDDIRTLALTITQLDKKLDGLQADFEREHDRLTREISVRDTRLSDIRRKRKRYDEIKIDAIIALDSQEPQIKSEQQAKRQQLSLLQEHFDDVTEKYRRIMAALDEELKTFAIEQRYALAQLQETLNSQRDASAKERDRRKSAIDNDYDTRLAESDQRLAQITGELTRAERRLSELKYHHPLEKEIGDCNSEASRLNSEAEHLRAELAVAQNAIDTLRKQGRLECDKIEQDYSGRLSGERERLKSLADEKEAAEQILARWKGSLYEWLTKHKPGWEQSIGKVIDENSVLYADNLDPRLTGDDASLYGVSLNLDAIGSSHRTPDEYRELTKQLQASIERQRHSIESLEVELKSKLDKTQKSFAGRIAEQQQQSAVTQAALESIPTKLKDISTRLRDLRRKEEAMINTERERRQSEEHKVRLSLEQENQARKAMREHRDKEKKAADRAFAASERAREQRLKEFRERQEAVLAERKADIAARRDSLERQERDELKGRGADTQAIEQCRASIGRLQATLERIDAQRHFVIEFRKDEEELFSHEQEFRKERQQLIERDESKRRSYDEHRERLKAKRYDVDNEKKQHMAEMAALELGLEHYRQLLEVERIVPDNLLSDDNELAHSQPLDELVTIMRGLVNDKRVKNDNLKRAVNSFNIHFSSDNTFNFAAPQYDEEYHAFALNLQEFVENDKIEEYRSRVSEHYNSILRSVAREVSLLMNHSAEISGIIRDINRDFAERNFAGVIREIELRAQESSDKLMHLMLQIHHFTEENSLQMGEQNLFSGSERDKVNEKVVELLKRFMRQLQQEVGRTELTLSDTFRLQFRIRENDNDTGWVERINNVGSDGTDILVKAMVNIMLINVFKTRAARRGGEFIIHCMMDEIGKLHPSNVKGILDFANARNIYLINSSPMSYNADLYKYNYLLTKDEKSLSRVTRLVTRNA